MKDIRVDLRFRNNLILSKMEEAGFPTVASLCNAHPKLSRVNIYRLVSLQDSPLTLTLRWTKPALMLAEVLRCLPADLFSEQLLESRKSNLASLEINSADVDLLTAGLRQLALPADARQAKKELSAQIEAQLQSLKENEQLVIKRRFGLGDYDTEETLGEIASSLGVSGERIRQIESKALRKLRHPVRAMKLSPYLVS